MRVNVERKIGDLQFSACDLEKLPVVAKKMALKSDRKFPLPGLEPGSLG